MCEVAYVENSHGLKIAVVKKYNKQPFIDKVIVIYVVRVGNSGTYDTVDNKEKLNTYLFIIYLQLTNSYFKSF